MSDELKPCPFCGGKPTFVHATSEDIGNGYVCRTLAVISCDHCMFDMTGETDEKAVVTWNARAERTCRNTDTVPDDGSVFYPSPHFRCSECGASYALTGYAYYCPNCGAKVAG